MLIDRLRHAKKIGFLFSGGSARCVFQIGVVETLYALGVRPAVCLGVSAGAWNAAAVAAGSWSRLRPYWKFFVRMPYVDLRNLAKEHSPFIWSRLHERAFNRYVGNDRIVSSDALPLYVALTRLRDRANLIVHVNVADDPFRILLASNYLPPFYTHPPMLLGGEKFGDGGLSNNIPFETLFELGCDAVVLMASKGESEGPLYRSAVDDELAPPPAIPENVVVIRPRHRLPLGFVERRWEKLQPFADVGALRAREVLLDERHPATDIAARGKAVSQHYATLRRWLRERLRAS